MPEKTLKEKVERARRFMAGFPDHEVELVQEALAALEARVEELEKERGLVEKWASGYFPRIGYDGFIAALKETKEAPDE